VQIFNRWREFYNHRRLHGSLGNKTPAFIWNRYEEQMLNLPTGQAGRKQKTSICTEALSINGERKSLNIEEAV